MSYKRLIQVLTGLILGFGVAEAIFYSIDQAAFPHVNVYVPDAELGLRLEPGASEYIAIHDNPRFHIRINEDGFRGEALPSPQADEILVVGDSQVFGLGVEEDQTFSALLAEKTGRTVINAGVPLLSNVGCCGVLGMPHGGFQFIRFVGLPNGFFTSWNRFVVISGWFPAAWQYITSILLLS